MIKMRKNKLSSLGLILPYLQKYIPKPCYDRDIDVSLVIPTNKNKNKKKRYEHNCIVISSRHIIYRRHNGIRPSLPYQGIARNPGFFMLSVVEKPVDPKCIITKML